MDKADGQSRVLLRKMCSKMLGAIDRPVLTSCAAERNHQAGESTPHICLNMRIYDPIDMFQKAEHFPILFKKPHHRLIPACQFLIWLIFSGIMD